VTAPALPGPFWLVGCGNMAGAMLEGWLAAGIDAAQLTVIRPSGKPVAGGIRVLTTFPEDEVPALVMLGFKPRTLREVAPALEPALDRRTILISILAGAEQSTLRSLSPRCETIVRAMPNTPVRIGKGVIALYSDSPDERARATVDSLMQPLGTVDWLADESLFDRITALSGCGPAFLFRFIDALAEAAATLGVPRDQAERFARAMVEGAGALAAATDESPGQLADRVASPGGSTRKGLDVLDSDGRLAKLLLETLEASVRRDREMAEEARRS
jgi:pyrroline-5-carboxylate reductase